MGTTWKSVIDLPLERDCISLHSGASPADEIEMKHGANGENYGR